MNGSKTHWFTIGWVACQISLVGWTLFVHPPLLYWWFKLSSLEVEIWFLKFVKFFE